MQPLRPPDTHTGPAGQPQGQPPGQSQQQAPQDWREGHYAFPERQQTLPEGVKYNQDGYQETVEQQEGQASYLTPEEVQASLRLRKRLRIGLIAFFLLAAGLFIRYQVLAIRNIRIIGNRNLSPQAIARAAGLDRSLFYCTVHEADIKERVNANRYLIFQGMEKIFPDTLRLTIIERRPFAFFTHLGIGYVLAQDGIILEQGRDLSRGQGLIQVTGLSVWGQMSPGSPPSTTNPEQAEELLALFLELDIWGFSEEIKQVDLAQALNISLLTRDGFTINLGDGDYLHAKVGTVQSVVHELRKQGMPLGIIEATLPGEATYLQQ